MFLSLFLSGQSYAVSLIGGSGPNEGYVSVNIDGTQGFVCDDHWGIEEVIRIFCSIESSMPEIAFTH